MTLAETLTEIREAGAAKRDPAVNEVMERTTAELAATDILQRLPSVGDLAPTFARPNIHNETIRLASELKKGPVILSFFRGRW